MYDLSIVKFAVGAKSDLAIILFFWASSYSNWAIIRSGLFFFESLIAEFKLSGNGYSLIDFLSKDYGSFKEPIIFS